jgi:hypothetical protein
MNRAAGNISSNSVAAIADPSRFMPHFILQSSSLCNIKFADIFPVPGSCRPFTARASSLRRSKVFVCTN